MASELHGVITSAGLWAYGGLFLFPFLETALVVTAFLPADILLFAAAAGAGAGALELHLVLGVAVFGAALGDSTNYWLGRLAGQSRAARWLVRPSSADGARWGALRGRYGGLAIVAARLTPYVRAIAPFGCALTGVGYARFAAYDVLGTLAWASVIGMAGYVFGGSPIVQENFWLIAVAPIGFWSVAGLFVMAQRARSSRARLTPLKSYLPTR